MATEDRPSARKLTNRTATSVRESDPQRLADDGIVGFVRLPKCSGRYFDDLE